MGFIESIKECLGAESLACSSYRAVLFGDTAGYFENVMGISHYQPEEIKMCLKKGFLIVRGEKLYVKKYCAGDVVICGKITAIVRE
jgi:sporulation protein YqfC